MCPMDLMTQAIWSNRSDGSGMLGMSFACVFSIRIHCFTERETLVLNAVDWDELSKSERCFLQDLWEWKINPKERKNVADRTVETVTALIGLEQNHDWLWSTTVESRRFEGMQVDLRFLWSQITNNNPFSWANCQKVQKCFSTWKAVQYS